MITRLLNWLYSNDKKQVQSFCELKFPHEQASDKQSINWKLQDTKYGCKGGIRLAASVTATSMSISSTSGFNISGNYVVNTERLNSGLKEIGAPFRIEMDKLEFDALNG